MIITCPKCNQTARNCTTRYGIRSSCCDLWSWDYAPLVDAGTHKARKAAHEAFDKIWKDKLISRRKAYKMLAKKLKIKPEECHMKLMNAETAQLVLAAAEEIKKEILEKGESK